MPDQCLSCCNNCENGQDCQNGGSCYCDNGPDTAQCYCFNGYTGEFCEIPPGMQYCNAGDKATVFPSTSFKFLKFKLSKILKFRFTILYT